MVSAMSIHAGRFVGNRFSCSVWPNMCRTLLQNQHVGRLAVDDHPQQLQLPPEGQRTDVQQGMYIYIYICRTDVSSDQSFLETQVLANLQNLTCFIAGTEQPEEQELIPLQWLGAQENHRC